MARKAGLGKGLGSLIPADDKKETKVKEIIKVQDTIDINKIEPNSNQPRKSFDEDKIQELADSIKQHGLIEPLIVQEGKKGFYKIIAGERRWRAAKLAGIKDIPVIVKEYSDQEIMEIALIENIQREDLNPIEEAEAYQRLIEEYQLKQDEVAEKVSKSRVAITNALRLLKLDSRVRDMLIDNKIKSGHARALLPIEDGEEQYKIAVYVFDQSMSVRDTEKYVKKYLKEKEEPKKDKPKVDDRSEIFYQDYEEKLKTILGTKVHIDHKGKNKGKIEIEYFNQDEFERLIDLMMKVQ